jgi:hypothetical protein
MKKILATALFFLVLGSSVFAGGSKEKIGGKDYPPEMDAWAKEAKLGKYDKNQDWDEIIAKAKKDAAKGVRGCSRFGGSARRHKPQGGRSASKETGPPPGLFDTLQSRHGDGRATAGRHVEAHERRDRGSAGPRPWRSRPRRGNARRGSASGAPGNTGPQERIRRVLKSLEPRAARGRRCPSGQRPLRRRKNGTKDGVRREAWLLAAAS